ncbi:hypothetical protein MLD38_017471 [Melastoma candidum]|uniref:Uncharacterized protein n=1 Tax=Melastoma candidum TaxID=119954 RepID=A0ACB9QU89_9MYRT|nr:hypothetical protein MLD38_017471 [Melastoma candidum]
MASASPSPSSSPVNSVSPPSSAAAAPLASAAPPMTALPASSPPDSSAPATTAPLPSSPVLPPSAPAAAVPPPSAPQSPAVEASPPPASPSFTPPATSPPPAPSASSPPPVVPYSPPPSVSTPATSPPLPPVSSPPPPSTVPPETSPPPPSAKPPADSPPPQAAEPPSSPATTSPPPSPVSSVPPPPKPSNPPPPPSQPASNPSTNAPPPPTQVPVTHQASPPPAPPVSKPPNTSPSPPSSNPPTDSPPTLSPPLPKLTPSRPGSPTSPVNTPPRSLLAPPPPILSPPEISGDPNSNLDANSASQTGSGIATEAAVVIVIGVSVVLLSLIVFSTWCFKKRKKTVAGLKGDYAVSSPFSSSPTSDSWILKTQSSAPQIGSSSGGDICFSPRAPSAVRNSRPWFTYEELVLATNGFADENLLGKGGFGSVYKGYLPDGKEIAVKQLKIGSRQGDREFKAEVEIISRIHHRHLVSLVGYCIAENQRLLVYDYVPNNTLYFHLHGKDRPALDWATRVKVAAGAARGLAYLHEGCHPRIIHRDIKSSNILLDDNFEARVSDFGLAKLALDSNTHMTTRVMGTFGYMAPEYASSGKLTEKSDVFSFGVVLLELITGRKPVDQSQPLGDESLVEWARPLLSHALENEDCEGLVDPRLENNYVEPELFQLIEAAAACVRHSAAKRPRMGQVVRAFDTLATSDLTNGMRLGDSEVYNSAQQDEAIRQFQRMAFGSHENSSELFSLSPAPKF